MTSQLLALFRGCPVVAVYLFCCSMLNGRGEVAGELGEMMGAEASSFCSLLERFRARMTDDEGVATIELAGSDVWFSSDWNFCC